MDQTEKEKKSIQPVKVYIRQRPFNKNEPELKCSNIIHKRTLREITLKSGFTEKKYCYDHVFPEEATQCEVYNTVVSPMIQNVISGYNCTVFAYGQTGTGKTHTIIGRKSPNPKSVLDLEDPSLGIIPRAATQIFTELSKLNPKTEYTVRVSFYEIYNEEVLDLLQDLTAIRVYNNPSYKGKGPSPVCMKGLTEATVCAIEDVYMWLAIGTQLRQTGATNHLRISRSHTIFTILVNTKEKTSEGEELIKSGKLHLVDLAGSENIGKSGTTDVRLREAATMNKSIICLGKVIKALAQKQQHNIPYRDSKLTRILQDSLGGNTETCMIATIAPGANACDETVSTLELAHIARSVTNYPQVNVNKKQANVLDELQDEINKLQADLTAARTGAGFYISTEMYQRMNRENVENHEHILQLLRQIKELEEYKREKSRQFAELDESFQQTNEHLTRVREALKETTQKVREKEFVLNYFTKKTDELSEKAEKLLEVCETSTKHEEIYYSKYLSQCEATLRNASIAKDSTEISVRFLKDIEKCSDSHLQVQLPQVNKMATIISTLKDNNKKDSEEMSKLSSEMQAQAKEHNYLTFQKLFENPQYSEENMKAFFDSLHDEHLTNQSEELRKLKMSAKRVRAATETAQEQSAQNFFDTVTREVSENEELIGDALLAMRQALCNKAEHNKKLLDRVRALKLSVLEQIDTVTEEHRELLESQRVLQEEAAKLLELNTMVDTRITDLCTIKTDLEKIKTETQDCFYNQSAIEQEKKNLVVQFIQVINEVREKAHTQMVGDCENIDVYLKGMLNRVKEMIDHYNIDLKSFIGPWLEHASATQDNSSKVSKDSSVSLNGVAGYMQHLVGSHHKDMTKLVEQSTENLENLEKNIILEAHAGDTPTKPSYKYPTELGRRVSENTLHKQFKQILEESEMESTSEDL